MNVAHIGREKLRSRLLKLYSVYEALNIITNNISVGDREKFARTKQSISAANKSHLQQFHRKIETDLKSLREHYGVSATNAKVLELAKTVDAAPGQSISGFVPGSVEIRIFGIHA